MLFNLLRCSHSIASKNLFATNTLIAHCARQNNSCRYINSGSRLIIRNFANQVIKRHLTSNNISTRSKSLAFSSVKRVFHLSAGAFTVCAGSVFLSYQLPKIVNCDSRIHANDNDDVNSDRDDGESFKLPFESDENEDLLKLATDEFDWQRLWQLLTPDSFYLFVAVASSLVVAFLNVQIPISLGNIMNVLSKFASEDNSVWSNEFFSDIKWPSLRVLELYVLQSVFTFFYITSLGIVGEKLACRLRQQLFASILQQDIAFFDEHKSGEIISRLTTDVQDFKSSFKLCISHGLRSSTQTVGCVISLFLISPKMTVLLAIVVPSIVLVGTLMGSILREMSKNSQAQVAKSAAVANEAIGNVRTVRAFAMEETESKFYNNETDLAEELNITLGYGIGVFQSLTNLALNGIVLGTLLYGGHLLASEELTPGNLMSFLVATQTIQRSLAQLSLLFGQYIRGVAAGSRIFSYLDMQPKIPLTGGITIPRNNLVGDVEFKNVTFSYPTRPQQVVLNNFSLRLLPGKVTALCGLSGSGKSTVAALLVRYYDTHNGSVNVDGYDMKFLDPSWLRKNVVGFINQEPVLFATTVMENIRYGRPEATDEEVYEAAKVANADSFIRNFPNGYNTIVGERGATVSGGQKQRIAIARAVLKNPSILVLDEATSALDAESEYLVQEALEKIMKGRTVLIIAHRLSTIQNADVIAVMSKGKVAEIGTHSSLKKSKGVYWKLVRQQSDEDE